jgi:uncharacterized protein YjdB
MLNLKKGLALVLAAATAFTFAPVANLGNAVQAEAATPATSDTIDIDATTPTTTGTSKALALTDGVWVAESNQKDSSNLGAKITVGKTSGYDLSFSDTAYGWESSQFTVSPDVTPENRVVEVAPTNNTSYTNNGTIVVTFRRLTKDAVVPNDVTTSSNIIAKSGVGVVTDDNQANATVTVTINIRNLAAPKIVTTSTIDSILKDENDGNGGKQHSIFRNDDGTEYNFSDLVKQQDGTTAIANASSTSDAATDKIYFEFSSANKYLNLTDVDAAAGKTMKRGWVKVSGKVTGKDTLNVTVKAAKDLGATELGSTGVQSIKKDQVVTTASYNFVILSDVGNIQAFNWKDYTTDKIAFYPGFKPDGYKDDELTAPTSTIALDTKVNKTVALNVVTAGVKTFKSDNSAVATVDQNGVVTAIKTGTAHITVYAAATSDWGPEEKTVTIQVSRTSQDKITAKVGDIDVIAKGVDLDRKSSTATNAVKSAQIEAKSAAGLPITYTLSTNNSDVATVSNTGLVTAGDKADTVTLTLTTQSTSDIKGDTKTVTVRVNSLPEAEIAINDIRLDLTKNKSTELKPTAVEGVSFGYILDSDARNIVDLTGTTLTARKIGTGKLTVTATPSSKTRYTEKTVNISVVENASKADSDLKVADTALTVKVGDTASAGASTTASGAAITYTSSDTDVATVAADGTITAVAPGTAVVTVKAAETDTVNAGTATIVVTVPSNPQKVTGVKVSNKKGAYVTVKWTSQGSNVNYRVYKKVGNGKWVGKNVAGSKTTLSVKKGAKVQVKVKSYVKDASGKTIWGPTATKAKTFKTDKK